MKSTLSVSEALALAASASPARRASRVRGRCGSALRVAGLRAAFVLWAIALAACSREEPRVTPLAVPPSASSSAGVAANSANVPALAPIAATDVASTHPTATSSALAIDAFEIDAFHPDHRPDERGVRPTPPAPAYGGTFTLHGEAAPKGLNYALENSGYARRILYELHETLLQRNWRTLELEPVLCTAWTVEDTLVPTDARADRERVFGKVTETAEQWIVTSADGGVRTFPRAEFARCERGTVFTFTLRDDVSWHDGHRFDARDVLFSIELYANPEVACAEKRFLYDKVIAAEPVGANGVRFFYAQQYFQAQASIGDLPLVPSHLYDLADPDNARADPEYHARRLRDDPAWKPTAAERAAYINTNRHNREWVGLGPYKLTAWTSEWLEAQRFDGYFAPEKSGYFDTLRWRFIPDFNVAFQAFLNGEVNFFNTLSTEQYFGASVASPEFQARAYTGWHATSIWWFVAWNTLRPTFQDPAVRRALARVFDFDQFTRTFYRGLATQITGPWPVLAPAYDRDVAPYAFDPERAADELAERGWYDRDDDGVLDKDGRAFEFELLMQPGNAANTTFSAKYQEELAKIGIRLMPRTLEWSALNERKFAREFDAIALGWSPTIESDPEQIWHSRWSAPDQRGGNFAGFADARCDELIERGQKELDPKARAVIWHELHARIYELQPYLFCYNPARKFALDRRVRGFTPSAIDPNYVLRAMHYTAGTPGTRATSARGKG